MTRFIKFLKITMPVCGGFFLASVLDQTNNLNYEAASEALPEHINLDETKTLARNGDQEIKTQVLYNKFRVAGIKTIKLRDSFYDSLTSSQFKEIRRAWEKYLYDNNIKYIFDLYDCDNYANAFKAFVETYNEKLGLNIAVGKFVVINKRDFAFIRGGERAYHMLNCIVVDGEVVIIEPQNSIYTTINKYPNVAWMLEVEV